MNDILIFVIGAVFGLGVAVILYLVLRRGPEAVAQELVSQAQTEKMQDHEDFLERIKDAFGALSLEAVSKLIPMAEQALSGKIEMGEKNLEGKKKLIDANIDGLKQRLDQMQALVSQFEKEREQKYGEISGQIKSSAEQTSKLRETTERLQQALASTKARGQWGERMAEDVLRLAGFVEGINYLKQRVLETAGSRPDYTFTLPQGLKINMDVKFPLDNYMRFLEAQKDGEKESMKIQFLRDVKARIKEVTTREYINPAEQTLDYVLVFIPNEQIYGFINESDPSIMDEALKSKVILCSPFTLYAVLAIIRQSIDNFNLERTAGDVLKLMGAFQKHWDKFIASMDKMGKKIDDAHDEFQALVTTRKNQLERQLEKIEGLRSLRGIEAEALLAGAEAVSEEPGNGPAEES